MIKMFLICYLLVLCAGCKTQQSERFKKYNFKDFTIETDTCKDGAKIKIIQKNNNVVYYNCFVDAFFIGGVDTININSDKIPDIVFSLQMDDYSILQILISSSNPVAYQSFELINISSVELYSERKLSKGDVLKEFIVTDFNKDGEKEILMNVILRGNEILPIENFTNMLTKDQIQEKITKE